MLRTFRAFAWLRWRLLRNQVRGAKRRDTLEQISRALALIVPAMLVALALGSIVGIGIIGLLAGRAVALGTVEPVLVTFITRVLLILALGLVVAMAVVAPVQSALTRYTRLLLLPIRRESLHLVEVAATLADPWLAAFVVGLVMLAAGLVIGGAWQAGVVALAAAVPLVALLALAGAVTGFLCAWLLRSRRRGEMFTLLFVLVLSFVSFVPMMITARPTDGSPGRRISRSEPFSIEVFDRGLPSWSRLVPSELYARAVTAGIAGEWIAAWRAILILTGEVAVLGLVSSRVYRRLLDSVESNQTARTRRDSSLARRWSLPGIDPVASAVALVQARTALRSVRGRLMVLLPGPMMALLPILLSRTAMQESPDAWAVEVAANGHYVLGLSLIFALYALQAFTMNMFGSDRSGLTLQFLLPIDDRTLARGKFVGCALVFSVSVVVCLVVALAVAPEVRAPLWIVTIAGAYSTLAMMFPGCVWLSALFPVAADLSKTGSGGNPHSLPMLVGTFGAIVAALPIAIPVLIIRRWPWAAWPVVLGTLLWLVAITAAAWFLVGVASRAIAARRENLALVAQGR